MAVHEYGRGPRRAVALHCSLASAATWGKLGGCLSDRLTLIAPDLPGHGSGPDWSPQADYMLLCEETVAPFLQEPVDLIGHSFGAVVALSLTIKYPERVRSLILYEPVLFAAARQDAPEAFDDMQAEAASYEQALAAGDMPQAARLFNRLWGDGTRWDAFPAPARRYMTDRMRIIPRQEDHVMGDVHGLYTPANLARVHMPCLLLDGDQSPQVVQAINSLLAAAMPDARCVTLEGVGHMGPVTHAEAVAQHIAAFLEVTEK